MEISDIQNLPIEDVIDQIAYIFGYTYAPHELSSNDC